MRFSWLLALTLAGSLTACGDSGETPLDAGNGDTGTSSDDAGSSADTGPADTGPVDTGAVDAGYAWPSGKPVVILMIGDGMGKDHVLAAGHYKNGAAGSLTMEQLPARGSLITGSLTGLTDSAASATAMATGIKTHNHRMAMDRYAQQPLETSVELAHRLGMAAGFATTSAASHGTPGAFTSHVPDRDDYLDVATGQAQIAPEVMMGGGINAFLPSTDPRSSRTDDGLIAPLESAGFTFVYDQAELMNAPPTTTKLVGLFAERHLAFVADRGVASTEPTLMEMTQKAIEVLDQNDNGYFLMVEGARIDSASHNNDIRRMLLEMMHFDAAVEVAKQYAEANPNVTLIVTADHECGGLDIVRTAAAGQLPQVTWRWTEHTNENVAIYGMGPGTEVFDGQTLPNTWVHAVTKAALTRSEIEAPPRMLVPDGDLAELREPVTQQTLTSDFGDGLNQIETMHVDLDAYGLAVGIEGLFEMDRNTMILLVDVDYGEGTGPSALAGAITDQTGFIDGIIANLPLTDPGLAGFGIDFVGASWGGLSAPQLAAYDQVGLRGIHGSYGDPADLSWYPMPAAYGEHVRNTEKGMVQPGQGWEVFLPWPTLYPANQGGVPPGATVAIAAIFVNDDGTVLSNQALPPFATPGTALPGIVRIAIDANADGQPDADVDASVVTP